MATADGARRPVEAAVLQKVLRAAGIGKPEAANSAFTTVTRQL